MSTKIMILYKKKLPHKYDSLKIYKIQMKSHLFFIFSAMFTAFTAASAFGIRV